MLVALRVKEKIGGAKCVYIELIGRNERETI